MNKYDGNQTLNHTPFFSTFTAVDKNGKKKLSIRAYRWMCIIAVNLLFFASFHIDLQILEGSLSGSRFLGFHLIDPFVGLSVFAANHAVKINLIIGMLTITLFYMLLAGRAFCAWVCPYGLISEIGEWIHARLVKRKLAKDIKLSRYTKYGFWVLFLALAFTSNYLVIELVNPVSITSRAIIYGINFNIIIVAMIFLTEVFFSQRGWCRYVCPVGCTYSMIGKKASTKIRWDDKCNHCGTCKSVCLVPHVLDITNDKEHKDKKEQFVSSGDCILCGRCVDVCHTDALNYDSTLRKLL